MTNNKIQAYAERIERLLDERDALNVDIKEIYDEVKFQKFDPRALRAIIAEQRKPPDASLEATKEAYRAALGAPGATYRSVAEQTGISKSKLQRLVPREENGTELGAEAERLGLTGVVRDLAAKHDEPDLTIPAHLRRTA